jgi:glutamine synthetase
MSYSTKQDILDFVEDNNVKFVRFAFCDIFGTQKNIAVLAGDLPTALEEGVSFDGSSVAGFMHVEESDLLLRPDLSTATILPWRPTEGRVMQFFCDVQKPEGATFAGNSRGFLREVSRRCKRLGLECNVGAECEFYLFETDDRGRPTRTPIDFGGYFDVAPLDAGENLRREICLTMEQMGLAPRHSHHECGNGQNEIDFHYADPLKTADNIMMFKQIVRAVAMRNGLHASFMPKPLADQAGSGLHINLSLTRDGVNLFEGDIAPDSEAGRFMAGILRHSRALTAFTNPLPNSYLRFGCDEAPRYVSWSRQNRSQLVRIPVAQGGSCRMELRSPDPACNPYLAIALVLAAGLDGIEKQMTLAAPVNKNLFAPGAEALGLESLPLTLEEAVAAAQQSEFVREVLPEGLAQRYFAEQLRRCEALKSAADPAEYERTHYFCAI